MRRFALFVVALQLCGILAFSQSPTANPAALQPAPNKPSFEFNTPQTRQLIPSNQFWKMNPSDGLNALQDRKSTQPNADQRFQMNASTPLLAMLSPSPIPRAPSNRIWPNAKAEPIPTQWPDAKFAPIPTTWPDLKILPVAGSPNSRTILSK
jgi:hypothetical protein